MVEISGHISLEDVIRVSGGEKAELTPEARDRMRKSRAIVDEIIRKGEPIYGINTGVGRLAEVRIEDESLAKLQVNIVRSHAVGVGEPFPREVVRAMMLLRVNTLALGYSGVRPMVVERLIEMLNRDIIPVVPSRGSVGASGDLAPLAHIALALIGEGEVYYRGQIVPSYYAMKVEGIEPVKLAAKEGLALINGTQASTAVSIIAYERAMRLFRSALVTAAMTFEAVNGVPEQFIDEIYRIRSHAGIKEVIKTFQRLIAGSELTGGPKARVQDAYSIRCIPQVHGAVYDGLQFASSLLEVEINSVTDNPIVLPDGRIVSNGNFHGQHVALAADTISTVMTTLGSISERRTFRLLDSDLSGLPAFLVEKSGLNSGLMMLQVTQAALVSENKSLAHPASVDSIPTSADQEDYVSMSMTAALKAYQIVDNTEKVIAIEFLSALQALDLRGADRTSPILKKIHSMAREEIPYIEHDRNYQQDIQKAIKFVRETLPEIEV